MGCPHTESEGGYSDTSRWVAEVLENWRMIQWILVFWGGSVVKNLPANAGNAVSIPGLGRSPGEGNGKPLQYPCLENSMDRGAWQAAVHGVAKSRTWLSTYSTAPMNLAVSRHSHLLGCVFWVYPVNVYLQPLNWATAINSSAPQGIQESPEGKAVLLNWFPGSVWLEWDSTLRGRNKRKREAVFLLTFLSLGNPKRN